MWIYDDGDPKPKHFAGRQIYNRINQTLLVNTSRIDCMCIRYAFVVLNIFVLVNRTGGVSFVERFRTEEFSLPALFLTEMCHVTNASLEVR